MNNKTKDELIIELQVLQQENNSLKEALDKDLTKRKKIEAASVLLNDGLSKVNQFSIELSMLSPEEDLKALILKRIKEISGAKIAMFSNYNPISKTLTTEHFEMDSGILKKFISLVSKKGQTLRSEVSDEMYQYITKEAAEVRKTFYEVSFGTIPRPIAAAIQALFRVDRFIGIAYLIEGELYGTSLLGMTKEKPDPQMQILKNFISLASVSLRRKQAEEKIREKDIQFRKLSAHVSDLIYQFTRRPDGSYFVPIASEGIINIFGCLPEDVLDDFTPISRVIYPDDAERVISDIEYSAKHLTNFTCEFRVQIPGKAIQWILSRSSPERLPDGSVTWYGFNADITDRKKAEQELITAKEHAEQSDRLKSAFLANMSHEIRTPMNGILGFANLLKEPELTGEQQQKYIGIIEKSGARMLNIINNIVDISKIEARLMELDLSESNINELIEYIYTFFKPEVETKGVKLSFKNTLPTKEAIIKTDREKFFAILTNLVKNAIKYTNKGSIEFGYNLVTIENTPLLQFFVKDTGIGIPKDRQEAIFERFIQADITDKKAHQGAGLGLSITKSYIEMLGGKIWVKSEEGKGSKFYFTLPYQIEPEAQIGVENNLASDKPDDPINKLKILLAEDDEVSEKLISINVKEFCNEIIKVRTGVKAVEACRNNPDIDLILMDIQMPEMSGHEATRQIRKFNKDVVIIAQTAYGLVGDREKALDAGCNDYITKPINSNLLKTMIQKLIKKQAQND